MGIFIQINYSFFVKIFSKNWIDQILSYHRWSSQLNFQLLLNSTYAFEKCIIMNNIGSILYSYKLFIFKMGLIILLRYNEYIYEIEIQVVMNANFW